MNEELKALMKSLEAIERNLQAQADKAEAETKAAGKVSTETKNAIEALGTQQREFADRLTVLEQKGATLPEGKADETWGAQLVKSEHYQAFAGGQSQKVRVEVKNTLTGSDTNVAPDRRPSVVPGASNILTIESLYAGIPTSSNAIEFTKEASFTNSAAEASEGAAKAESALTWSLVNQPISTIAHWIKISRQLAMDNAALAAYVNARMTYGVNRRAEAQLVTGDGVAPNIPGFMKAGNFTAHGYTDANLAAIGSLKKLILIRKVLADLWNAGYPANAIVLNAADFATIECEIMGSTATGTRIAYDANGSPRLFGIPVVQSIGMTADLFAVGDFAQHGSIYNREGVIVELSESDSDNFTKNLITVRAERRMTLTSEVPAAIRGGDLTPA